MFCRGKHFTLVVWHRWNNSTPIAGDDRFLLPDRVAQILVEGRMCQFHEPVYISMGEVVCFPIEECCGIAHTDFVRPLEFRKHRTPPALLIAITARQQRPIEIRHQSVDFGLANELIDPFDLIDDISKTLLMAIN